ncbi:MAG: ParB/RepB/Spo0J family partition protein [Bacteroidota bacterium]
MSPKRNVLGKGLSALLEDYDTDITSKPIGEKGELGRDTQPKLVGTVANIDLDKIETNPFQPRTNVKESNLDELAVSIEKLGIVQPVTVRKLGYDKYQLITGERRFKAAKIAGLTKIPAYIRVANDQAMLEMSLVENIQREDLNAMEIAVSYQRLTEECKLTQEELSERVGKNRTTIINYLRLLKLPPEIQIGIRENTITMGHARALINIDDSYAQLKIFSEITRKNLSVRQVEELVRNLNIKTSWRKKTTSLTTLSVKHQQIKDELASYFNTKVDVKHYNKGKGKIVIPFRSDNDLERIMQVLNIAVNRNS